MTSLDAALNTPEAHEAARILRDRASAEDRLAAWETLHAAVAETNTSIAAAGQSSD